jgi:hypothetical protein
MEKIRFFVVIVVTLFVSSCSTTGYSATETPVGKVEAQPSLGAVAGEPVSGGNVSSVAIETPTRGQPAETEQARAPDTPTPSPSQPVATTMPLPSSTPRPTLTALPSATPVAAAPAATTDAPDVTPEASTIETSESPNPAAETPESPPVQPASATMADAIAANPAPATQSMSLERIQDPDPAPPLTILVSSIRIAQNSNYKVTGTVRNDSSEIFGGVGVVATFYEKANTCSEIEVTRRPRPGEPGGETVTVEMCDYNWHGPVKVYAACTLVEPGAECPFSLEIYPKDYVSYLLHPEGTATALRQPAPVTLSGVSVTNTGLGYVRITGTATNGNPFTVRDANINAVLTGAAGQMMSVGSVTLPGGIPSGASVSFDLRIKYEPYTNYRLSAQAIQG